MSEEEKSEKVEVPVVQVAAVAVAAEEAPARDRSEDGVLSKFVVCIVELPFVVIGITLAISLIIAIFTLYQVLEVYGAGQWFAQGRKGSEDMTHITSLSYDAIDYAMDKSWPNDPTVQRCGGGRKGFRRMQEDESLIQAPAAPSSGLQNFLAPFVAERLESTLAAEGAGMQLGLQDHIKDLPLDLRTQPLSRIPVDWTPETGVIWEDELPADDSRRRLQRGGGDGCEEEPEPEPEGEDSGVTVTWDYSNCNVNDAAAPKHIDPNDPTKGIGATGPGCNKLCDPLEDDECEGTMSNSKDFFVLVFEAVSGDNTFYAPLDDDDIDDTYPYNPYDAGPGDAFSEANLKEAKRLQDVILQSDRYLTDFCQISPDPRTDPPNQGKCGQMMGLINFFYPRAKQSGQQMFDELERAFPPGMPMGEVFAGISAALQTDFGCHLQYFFFEMYQGGAGIGPVMTILGTVLAAVTATETTDMPLQQVAMQGLASQDLSPAAMEAAMPAAMAGAGAACVASGGTVEGTMCMGMPNEMYALKNTLLPTLIAKVDETRDDSHLGGFAGVFEMAMCNGLTSPTTEDACGAQIGCVWDIVDEVCVEDRTYTDQAEAFADIMCLGDGTGPEQSATWNAERAQTLADFHSEEHLKPFLDFYFDRGFSPTNPTTKFSRAFMQFGGPMPGYKNMEEGEDEKTGVNAQQQDMVDWFMEDVNNPSGQSIRVEYSDKSTADEPDDETGGQVEVTYLLSLLLFDEIIALVVGDMLLAVISFAIVGFYMWFQTGSLWIATFGMLEITMSLPIALWVYTYLFGIEYFDTICSLALYIVMAIGADDVFIWFDAYKQSAYEDAEISGSLESRFIWAWHKAASAMLVTSLTTCVAFFATATSPMLSIKSFGYYTAFVIWLDYIYVITWLPAATVLYNWWFENTGFCRCTCCPSSACAPVAEEDKEAIPPVPCCLAGGETPKAIGCGALFALPFAIIFSSYFWWLGGQGAIYAKAYGIGFVLFVIMFVGLTSRVAATIIQGKEGRKTVEFFEGPFSDFITDEKTRKALLIGAVCIAIPFFIAAFSLSPTTKDEQILPDDHPLQKIISIMNGEFPVSGRDEKVKDQMVFGIDGADPFDRKGANPLLDYMRDKEAEAEAAANGEQPEANFVSFDWTSPATQQFLAETCISLDESTFVVADQDPDCDEDPCDQFKTACIVADLATWLSTDCSDDDASRDCTSAREPVPEDHPGFVDGEDRSYLDYYGITAAGLSATQCSGAAEICATVFNPPDAAACPAGCTYQNAFLSAVATPVFAADPAKANRAIWDFYQLSFKSKFSKAVGFGVNDAADCVVQVDVNTEETVTYCAPNPDKGVKYIALQYSVDLKRRAYYPEAEFFAVYDQIEKFADAATDSAFGGAKPAHRTTSGKWKFMQSQHIYVKYALWGIACAILLAFCVLCVATNNIITAALAVLTIGFVCICVLGSMVFGGWELGNMESICLTILAGFCVDYIVHLAHSFMESPDRSTREARVRYSVGHMGVSVLSGALTSLGASLLLFFCTLQFFATFGTFFFGTILLAWVWANFFFIPALGTIGPEGIQGDFYGNMFGPKAEEGAGGKETTGNPAAKDDDVADLDDIEVAED